MTIIGRILDTAKNNGLTQKTLAETLNTLTEINITKQTISDWKSGKSNSYYYCISELASIFNTSTDYLLTGKEPNTISLPAPSSEQNTALTSDENTLIELFRKLPDRNKYEFIGELKGYVKCLSEQNSTNKAKDAVS